jgi:hypothetical protein
MQGMAMMSAQTSAGLRQPKTLRGRPLVWTRTSSGPPSEPPRPAPPPRTPCPPGIPCGGARRTTSPPVPSGDRARLAGYLARYTTKSVDHDGALDPTGPSPTPLR